MFRIFVEYLAIERERFFVLAAIQKNARLVVERKDHVRLDCQNLVEDCKTFIKTIELVKRDA